MLKYKEVIQRIKKACIICNEVNNNGIIIKENCICEKCISNIVNSDVNDDNYDFIVEKIKKYLVKPNIIR